MFGKPVAVIACCALLAACAHSSNNFARPIDLGEGATATLTSGDVRLVTVRSRTTSPISGAPTRGILCSEPSPDYATALATSLAVSGSGSAPGGPTASASVNSTSAETITQFAGRTAGIVALRDGLYAACQAYTNGVLGQDAYALVLSQYGNLLLGLVGSSGGGGTAAANANSDPATPASKASTPPSAKASGGGTLAAETPGQAAVQALLVACVSEYDPTRLGALDSSNMPDRNIVLDPNVCRKLVKDLSSAAPELLMASGGGTGARTCAPGTSLSGVALVRAYQTRLATEHFYNGPVDGHAGKQTAKALAAYQRANHLAVTARPDAATLAAMELACTS